jgi:hypothetical protein
MHRFKELSVTGSGIVLLLALVLLFGRWQSPARAAEKKSAAPARAWYLTKETHAGGDALSACAVGYHMASLWEIHEPSNLRYDTEVGFTSDDSGSGPPTGKPALGWIRTGRPAVSSGNVVANCNAWTSNANTDFGSAVSLSADWGGAIGVPGPIAPWDSTVFNCDATDLVHVWCVQD